MRERDRAEAMATEAELGRYIRFASPSYSDDWIFFGGLGAFMGWGVVVLFIRMFEHRANLADKIIGPICLVMVLALFGISLYPTWDRRPGGPTPRLYCFEHGLVLAVRGDLNLYRWTDITITREKWSTGSGDNHESGTRRTLSTHDGRTLVTFRGNEPGRAGYYELDKIYRASGGG